MIVLSLAYGVNFGNKILGHFLLGALPLWPMVKDSYVHAFDCLSVLQPVLFKMVDNLANYDHDFSHHFQHLKFEGAKDS